MERVSSWFANLLDANNLVVHASAWVQLDHIHYAEPALGAGLAELERGASTEPMLFVLPLASEIGRTPIGGRRSADDDPPLPAPTALYDRRSDSSRGWSPCCCDGESHRSLSPPPRRNDPG